MMNDFTNVNIKQYCIVNHSTNINHVWLMGDDNGW